MNFSIQAAEREAKNEQLGIKDNEEQYFTSTESDDDDQKGGETKTAREKNYIISRNHDQTAQTLKNNKLDQNYLELPDTKVYRKSIDTSASGGHLGFGQQKTKLLEE